MLTLLTRRDRLAETRWRPGLPIDGPEQTATPSPGQVLLRVEHLALTANVFTYGAIGDAMGYWKFWPTGDPVWGCLPAWGTARVVAGQVHALPVGSRIAGLLPTASHALLEPERITATSVRDGAAHRRGLMAAYQHYERLAPAPVEPDVATDEALASLLRPLVVLAARVADAVGDDGPAPATVVLTSASSRTARAIARELRGGPRLLGLTSAPRVADVRATRLYDAVRSYAALDSLGHDAAAGPVVLLDLAGRADLRAAIRAALGDRAAPEGVRTLVVGATHGAGDLAVGPGEEVFVAPDRMRLRAAAWGGARLAGQLAAAWHRHVAEARAEVELLHATTRRDVEGAYADVRVGGCPLSHGHLVTIPTA